MYLSTVSFRHRKRRRQSQCHCHQCCHTLDSQRSSLMQHMCWQHMKRPSTCLSNGSFQHRKRRRQSQCRCHQCRRTYEHESRYCWRSRRRGPSLACTRQSLHTHMQLHLGLCRRRSDRSGQPSICCETRSKRDPLLVCKLKHRKCTQRCWLWCRHRSDRSGQPSICCETRSKRDPSLVCKLQHLKCTQRCWLSCRRSSSREDR